MNQPSFDVVPFSPLRKAIASRTTEAKRTIPHYRLTMNVHMDELLAVRHTLNQRHFDYTISINDLIIKACAIALLDQPELNIQLVGDEIHRYHQADISIIVAVPGGLSTPIVRGADTKPVEEIAREVRALTDRATKNQLKSSEVLGGTFSISNLGMYGIDQFDAVINPPQCAILAVGEVQAHPVVHQGEIITASLMSVTLSLDHRAIDGVTGATFLKSLREKLEHPEKIRPYL
jgi:pyruvate dehydrogenase E2 component (dihydrolipoamide acetyltransferase)